MHRAAIYARISSDPEGTHLGVQRQVEDCQRFAAARAWTVAGTYIDEDVSAYSGRPRPQYRALLADIKAGAIDAVLVWHLDRLVRQPKELEEFFEACDSAGVRALASVTGDVDLGTHDGRFMARILGAVARKESDDKSRRIKRKALELAHSGRQSGGGTRPYGYQDDRVTINELEAAVIREAASRILAGDSLRAVCLDLDARGIKSTTGRSWSVQVMRRMLMRGYISGQREHLGEIVAPGQWPAIITPEQTARLRAILSDPARRTNRTPRRYLLAGGLVRCATCGATMQSRPRVDGSRRYLCVKGPAKPGCGGAAVMAEPLEHLVSEAVLYRLDGPDLARTIADAAKADDAAAASAAQVARDTDQLQELAETYARRDITHTEWLAARKLIERRIETGKAQLAAASRASAVLEFAGDSSRLRTQWATITLSRQRAIIAAVLDHVTIGRAVRGRNTFDARRVAPVWRL